MQEMGTQFGEDWAAAHWWGLVATDHHDVVSEINVRPALNTCFMRTHSRVTSARRNDSPVFAWSLADTRFHPAGWHHEQSVGVTGHR